MQICSNIYLKGARLYIVDNYLLEHIEKDENLNKILLQSVVSMKLCNELFSYLR